MTDGQIEATLGVQGWDQEGDAVDEHIGAQRREQADGQHRPAPEGADRRGVHTL